MMKINKINKSFGDNHVLRDISMTIKDGSIFGIIGINGSGKSTLLRLISGVLLPDSGEMFIDDQSILHAHIKNMNIFYLSDQPAFTFQMTLSDLMKFYQVFYPMDIAFFEDILKRFKLDKNMVLSKISKGLRRQCYIAIAFSSGAKYLLLDEVFDGLDPLARMKFKQLMVEQLEDKTFILTSHSLRELEDICDTFGMIDQGYFKRYGEINTEVQKLKKYQIILKHIEEIPVKSIAGLYDQTQDGRILTIIIEPEKVQIDHIVNLNDCHVIDELPLSFEEYFLVSQGEYE